MIQALALAGAFSQIKGLIVGGMTDLKETAVPTNWDFRDLFLEQLQFRNIPVAFDVPIGHIDDNRAVICGREAFFEVNDDKVFLNQ
jgi:muramoyltetrapeptide carboxypeptidase